MTSALILQNKIAEKLEWFLFIRTVQEWPQGKLYLWNIPQSFSVTKKFDRFVYFTKKKLYPHQIIIQNFYIIRNISWNVENILKIFCYSNSLSFNDRKGELQKYLGEIPYN